ncbi:uncharacterized protein LOC123909487 [Trifolium pratense]|uniref:Uncharacterized protein n=1 Tax=Trifolium pratense TaxID=57577 RepID=A0ACB0LB86_TRIPR|nr:uncharacterized protein LOC123909487 [Trifolium pratense]CAJ2666673.1 unnamed protein product [Trifolium pratense]
MDPLLPPPWSWNPEDDFLLKEAIENGASLESLARGAVSFSRRYSLEELTERWGSLLFDSDVAEEAAAAMTKFEIAKYHGNTIKEATKKKVDSPKRKTHNICKQFNIMRKKIHKEVIEEDENIK